MQHQNISDANITGDIAKGFTGFVDRILRGRTNKTVLNSSIAFSALDVGIPSEASPYPFDIPSMLMNNRNVYNPGSWGTGLLEGSHPLFDFSHENFTLFGLDFPDMMKQFRGEASEHHAPLYTNETGQSLAEAIGLPDLPYMEMAHLAHMGMALYDTGRTFQDVWKQLGDYYEQHNTSPEQQGLSIAAKLGKTITHPDMLHTLAARGTMLTVMGLLHPLGGVIAIGVAYLCAHLVHSAFGVLERNKEIIQKVEDVPLLSAIYNATGIKEWAERDMMSNKPEPAQADEIDPYQETELNPHHDVQMAQRDGRLGLLAADAQVKPA